MADTTTENPHSASPEEIWAILRETSAIQKENSEKIRELREQMKETSEQMKETDRRMQETDRKMQETDRLIKENSEQIKVTDRQIKKTSEQMEETDRQIKLSNQQMGGLHNSFGNMVEHLVAPNIKEKFNKLGFTFTSMTRDLTIWESSSDKKIAEVDILLENGDVVISVSIKATPREKDVETHIRQMEILRQRADSHQDHRKYQGAIAGANVDDNIRRTILQAGFYMIEQTGDTVKINIPEGFKPREW